MSIYKFSPKSPEEKILVTFDFTNMLVTDTEVLLSANWSVALAPVTGNSTWPSTVVITADTNPAALLAGPIYLTPTSTSNFLIGGLDKNIYEITVIANTSAGQVLKMVAEILVEA